MVLDDIRVQEDGWALLTEGGANVYATESNTEPDLVYYLFQFIESDVIVCSCTGFRMSKVATESDNLCTHIKDWTKKYLGEDDGDT
jgi:hypothetical protein